jgi:hypothetical protein
VTHCEGSLFYRPQSGSDVHLPDGFVLRLGFFQALYLTQAGLTLNLQTTLTKFYPDMEILDFLEIHLKKDIRKYGMTSNDYEKAKTVLNGCKITTRQSNYTQVKNKIKSINIVLFFFFCFCLRFIKFEVFLIFPNDKHLFLPKTMDNQLVQILNIILFNFLKLKKGLKLNIQNCVVYNVIFYMIDMIQNIYLWKYVEYFNGKNVNVR